MLDFRLGQEQPDGSGVLLLLAEEVVDEQGVGEGYHGVHGRILLHQQLLLVYRQHLRQVQVVVQHRRQEVVLVHDARLVSVELVEHLSDRRLHCSQILSYLPEYVLHHLPLIHAAVYLQHRLELLNVQQHLRLLLSGHQVVVVLLLHLRFFVVVERLSRTYELFIRQTTLLEGRVPSEPTHYVGVAHVQPTHYLRKYPLELVQLLQIYLVLPGRLLDVLHDALLDQVVQQRLQLDLQLRPGDQLVQVVPQTQDVDHVGSGRLPVHLDHFLNVALSDAELQTVHRAEERRLLHAVRTTQILIRQQRPEVLEATVLNHSGYPLQDLVECLDETSATELRIRLLRVLVLLYELFVRVFAVLVRLEERPQHRVYLVQGHLRLHKHEHGVELFRRQVLDVELRDLWNRSTEHLLDLQVLQHYLFTQVKYYCIFLFLLEHPVLNIQYERLRVHICALHIPFSHSFHCLLRMVVAAVQRLPFQVVHELRVRRTGVLDVVRQHKVMRLLLNGYFRNVQLQLLNQMRQEQFVVVGRLDVEVRVVQLYQFRERYRLVVFAGHFISELVDG